MSERIYVLLLRLYPSRFRESYGEDALQLLRDRARDETGFVPRLRLWFDLLADLVVSLARGYPDVQTDLNASPQRQVNGSPSFHVLRDEALPRGVLLLGSLLSVGAIAAVPASISHFGNQPSQRTAVPAPPRSSYPLWSASSRPALPDAAHAGEKAIALGRTDVEPNDLRSQPIFAAAARPSPQPPQQATLRGPTSVTQVAMNAVNPHAAGRRRVIHAVIASLKKHYVDPAGARKIADALLAHETNGDYDAVADGPAFAALLTRQLRDLSGDVHLEVIHSQRPLPDRPPAPAPEGIARYRKAMEVENCTVERAEILRQNIGYLKLNSFPDVSICHSTITAAMASLNEADAIIFDLRDNRGGHSDMVMLIAAYLFDRPEYLYNPRENTTRRSWTRSPAPGSKLADKPVYVLTSGRSASAAEHFSYNLKMLKRATLVGETTRGSAHAGVFHRIDRHFGIAVPEVKPINPFSDRDWEGTGVEPDVKVKAEDALEKAKKLAGTGRRLR